MTPKTLLTLPRKTQLIIEENCFMGEATKSMPHQKVPWMSVSSINRLKSIFE